MKSQERVALLYLGSVLGMGAVAYMRGRRGTDLITDSVLYGLAVGTGANALWYTASGENPLAGVLPNPDAFAQMPKTAVRLLTQVDPDVLLRPMNAMGVKIAESPSDPNVVTQEMD